MLKTAVHKAPKEKAKNVVDILIEDHERVKSLFAKFEETEAKKQKQKIVHELITELQIHTQVEEEILYPALRQMGGPTMAEMMDEADEEHHVAKGLMKEISNYGSEDGHYDAKVTVLGELIAHHVEEEEGPAGMFAKAKRLTGIADLTHRLVSRKKELAHQYSLEKRG